MDGLGRTLLKRNLLTPEQLEEATQLARQSRRPLGDVLIERRMADETLVLQLLAEEHGLAFVELRDIPIEAAAIKCVPAKLASHYRIVPVRYASGVLTIAVSNPLDMTPAEDIETNLGFRVERVLSRRQDILAALRTHYGVGADTVERILAEAPEREDRGSAEEAHDLELMADDASVVRLVNQLLQDAIRDRATDLHFEAQRDGIVVRRRIDGVLYDTNIPRNARFLYPALVSRVKLMSGLNIVERRLPQDGRSRVKIGARDFDLRVSVVPAIHGEDVVIRILPATMLYDLGQLGFSEEHLKILENLISRPHGIIFVTGPTGSGKSTTLYSCLVRLNSRDRKIITIEDPVEYELKGITQTQVHPRIGLTFAHALRSLLRHDPDIMMVGEVRDRETAEIAIQTAMTGHLVLSSLHTNDAAGAAVRLIDMGIDPYLITSTVLVFVAQRLVRVICSGCREPEVVNGERVYRGRGCRTCNGTGYFGRVAITEFLPLVPAIQTLILDRASAKLIRARADELGMSTLLQDGQRKVAAGVTTMAELLRVTSL